VWKRLKDNLVSEVESLTHGDVTDLRNFMGAVIDRRAFNRLAGVLRMANESDTLSVVAGGTADDTEGFFVRPTVIVGDDPAHEVFATEYFGPILAVHVYDDGDYDRVLQQVDRGSQYGLTGSIIARDRSAVLRASRVLRFAAGNFYVNDKPTGAVVGQQPFGGARGSGTNDKAGSTYNLLRWVSPRTIKESFSPPVTSGHPHQL
jgi:1-pyrroline-5-carboxylate dehydrogenase